MMLLLPLYFFRASSLLPLYNRIYLLPLDHDCNSEAFVSTREVVSGISRSFVARVVIFDRAHCCDVLHIFSLSDSG
jgi:hypothetical protein